MKKILRNSVLVSLVLVFAAVSVAADKKAPKKGKGKGKSPVSAEARSAGLLKKFPQADKDKDGKLSKEEMKSFRAEMAEKMAAKMLKDNPQADTNKDGKLSREEITAFRKANAKKSPKGKNEPNKQDPWTNPSPERTKQILKKHPEADANKDGKLDAKEMLALKKKYMNTPIPAATAKKMLAEHPEIDANKDGKLTRSEIQKWSEAKKKAKTPANKDDKKKGKDSKKKGPSQEQLAKMLKRTPAADANKDGKLTAEEAMEFRKAKSAAMMLKKHPEADKNKDGKLSDNEMKELRKNLKEAQKAGKDKAKKEKAKKGKGKKK